MKIKRISLSIKFSLSVGLILLMFCTVFSVILYHYLKNQMLVDAEERTMIIMSQIKAVGSYVRENLRPAMFKALDKLNAQDEFIVEAMSTTHVSLQVMEMFNRDLRDYSFKRVSDNPMNPKNMAEDFHIDMLKYFRQNKDKLIWKGIVTLDNGQNLIRARPIYMEEGCLTCHGDPKDAPRELLRRYGKSGGFYWEPGNVIGVETVGVSIDYALADVKRIAFDTFFFGLATLGVLFLALYGAFRHIVTMPLTKLSHTFRLITEGKEELGRAITINRRDEIGDLTNSFNTLSSHLIEAQEHLRKAAKIERQMMETEKFSALGQLSAGVAHEINNPLGGIKLCFNNLMTTDMDNQTKERHINLINAGLERIHCIVRQLLDFAKDSPLCTVPISINSIIKNVLDLTDYTISKQGISLVKDIDESMPEIKGDPNKLEQVFLNLVINAIHAMNEGGKITVKTWHQDGCCYVAISDTGSGIPEEIKNRVFDPFFTTKGVNEGTGLGLTVSKSIVEHHKGSISFTSSLEGTTFLISLPIAEKGCQRES